MMQLTKKIEKEVLQVYDTWLHSYLNGDVATYDSYFDDDYHFIGSTDNEEFLSRKETTKFFEKTADQLAGKCDLRKETRILEQFGELVFITHVFDAWFINGTDYSYYGRFRFTNILHENKDGWRFIYQHFSTPDSKTEEGETIGFDRINAENQELREAIKRRTVELEQKNRELEIETALERIRAQVTSMEKSEDLLDIVVSMRKEFVRLGHEAHYFWHMRWHPDKYEKAMTSGDGARIGNVMELPRRIHKEIKELAEWEKSEEPTIVFTMDAEAALDYVHKMIEWGDFQRVDPNVPTDDDIRHIGGLTYVMARTSLGEIGYSLPGEVKNVPQSDLDILVRFARAFDLAHKRFEDLKKREQQTREMQIELALERVRSRTMAMYQTAELQEVIHIVHKELLDLNISIEGGSFVVINKDVGTELRLWGAGGTANTSEEVQVPHFDMPFCTDLINGIKRGPGFFTEEFSQQEKKDFFTKLFKHKPWSDLSSQQKKETLSSPGGYTRSVAVSKHTSILIINQYGRKFTEDENDILKRFGKVFEQTYTRFLDLQKAEAQAREAKIEAALERVRSRTMAMQKSTELSETASLIFKQVEQLGLRPWSCGFNIWDHQQNSISQWVSTGDGRILPPFQTPLMRMFLLDSWPLRKMVNHSISKRLEGRR
jgi:ketosteroid isomerase-like protein